MDWSSDVCSSDLDACLRAAGVPDVACVRAISVTFSLPFKGRAGVGIGFPSAPGMPDHAPIDPDHPHAERHTHHHPTLPLKGKAKAEENELGRGNVCTPDTQTHLVCLLLLENKNTDNNT